MQMQQFAKLEEGDFVTDISRFMNKAIRPGFYERASKHS